MLRPGTQGKARFRGRWRLTDLFRASFSSEAWPRGNILQSLAVNLRGQQLLSLISLTQVCTVEEGRRKLLAVSRRKWLPDCSLVCLVKPLCAQSTLDGAWEAEVTILVPKILSFVSVVDSTT